MKMKGGYNMNRLYVALIIPLLLLSIAGFAIAESVDIEDGDDDSDSVSGVDDSEETSDPFESSDETKDVEDALEENEVDDDDVKSVLSGDSAVTHVITHGQGYLVSSSGEISLTSGFWNSFTRAEVSRGKGFLNIGGAKFVLKATSSSETEKKFDLYRREVKVGSATFTRTKTDNNKALWDVDVSITTDERSVTAEGVFATATRSVTKSQERDDDSDNEKVSDRIKEARELAKEEAKQTQETSKRWFQFWKREAKEVGQNNADSDAE
ncbi:MAG: hypothetical protein AABW79_04515 [Nanoarchaeota archaeon]